MKRGKYLALFLISLIIFQLTDYVFFTSNISEINNKLIFGFLGNNILAIIVTIILITLLYKVIPKTKTFLSVVSLLVAAVSSNITDRLAYGGVIDYIKIWFVPIFNLADVIIVGSIIIIIFWQLIKKPHQE